MEKYEYSILIKALELASQMSQSYCYILFSKSFPEEVFVDRPQEEFPSFLSTRRSMHHLYEFINLGPGIHPPGKLMFTLPDTTATLTDVKVTCRTVFMHNLCLNSIVFNARRVSCNKACDLGTYELKIVTHDLGEEM